jgi:hypothetical protein
LAAGAANTPILELIVKQAHLIGPDAFWHANLALPQILQHEMENCRIPVYLEMSLVLLGKDAVELRFLMLGK